MNISHKRGLLSLSPIMVLLVVYLAGSLLAGDFYRIPIGVAFITAAIYAIAITRGKSLSERIETFSQGAANSNIMYMVWIFVLAGVFAESAKQMGAVDATVQLTLRFVPDAFLPAGIFVAACFISMSVGTSVGTIVALTPVVTGLAEQMGCDTAWAVAIVVGGAFFGDNLSFISDTTIAATQSQGCRMRDKFRTNLMIVLPAAIATLAIYLFTDMSEGVMVVEKSAEWFRALPYVVVIICALAGINVLGVLMIGIIITNIIGFACGSFDTISAFAAAGEGMRSMLELILVTLLAGGLMNVVKCGGGFDYLISLLTRHIGGRRTAEASIATLTALTNLCTANNTIAILTAGPIARDIATQFGVSPRRSASLMDTASCFVQGVIPYGAQLLMASGLAEVSPLQIIPHLYYPVGIGIMVVLAIIFQFPREKQTLKS
ncbi:MAG: Na+/H+ antiporter NhaC family protein [Alistipes sp.]|nr:Na+/H+ antiporter NhaC family protein [Alistipes sp.]